MEYYNLKAEISTNLQKIEANLDFYGNPHGWVPSLNIVANYSLYKKVIENSIRTIAEVNYLNALSIKSNQKVENLRGLMVNLRLKNQTIDDKISNIFHSQIPELEYEIKENSRYAKKVQKRLEETEINIQEMAVGEHKTNRIKEKQRNLLNFFTSAAKIVPIYQSTLGTVALGIEAFTIDYQESPFDKIQNIIDGYDQAKKYNEDFIEAVKLSKDLQGNTSITSLQKNKRKIYEK